MNIKLLVHVVHIMHRCMIYMTLHDISHAWCACFIFCILHNMHKACLLCMICMRCIHLDVQHAWADMHDDAWRVITNLYLTCIDALCIYHAWHAWMPDMHAFSWLDSAWQTSFILCIVHDIHCAWYAWWFPVMYNDIHYMDDMYGMHEMQEVHNMHDCLVHVMHETHALYHASCMIWHAWVYIYI